MTDLLETRRAAGFRITLYKIRAHTNIRGNDLADAAAKLAVKDFETLPLAQTIRVDIGEIAFCSPHRVVYTVTQPVPDPALSTDTNRASLRRH